MILDIWQESNPKSTSFGFAALFASCAPADPIPKPATDAPTNPPLKAAKVFRLDIPFLRSSSIHPRFEKQSQKPEFHNMLIGSHKAVILWRTIPMRLRAIPASGFCP
jgi:hypothetical protein